MQEESVITRAVRAAPGVLAPGHLGELTQTIDFALADAVVAETRTRERRRRLLPSRVVACFVLALALFEDCSYQAVWGKLTAGPEHFSNSASASTKYTTTRDGKSRRRHSTVPVSASTASTNAKSTVWVSSPR